MNYSQLVAFAPRQFLTDDDTGGGVFEELLGFGTGGSAEVEDCIGGRGGHCKVGDLKEERVTQKRQVSIWLL